jgi:xylulokinase
MGLFDMANQCWAGDLIGELGLRLDQFVDCVAPGTVIGSIHAPAAAATGLPVGLPVIAGAGDGQCAGFGAIVTCVDRAYLILGTAVASGAFTQQFMTDRAFRTLNAPLPRAYFLVTLLRGGVFTIGWFVEKFAADLRHAHPDKSAEALLSEAAAQVPPGALGLMLVPYWNNVMNPYWDPNASGITIGWTGAHGREHFYRALLEGIAYEQRLVGDGMMHALGQRFSEYVAMGGGSRSDLWLQIIADVTGIPVVRSTTTEATCLGAAILAAAAVGWYSGIQSAANHMTSTAERFIPDLAAQAIYEPLYQEVYKPLFPTLQALSNRLTVLTHG